MASDRISTKHLLEITGIKRSTYFAEYRNSEKGLKIFDTKQDPETDLLHHSRRLATKWRRDRDAKMAAHPRPPIGERSGRAEKLGEASERGRRVCPHCRHRCRAGARVCSSCGRKLPPKPAAQG